MYRFTITTLVVGVLFFHGYNLLVILRKTNFFDVKPLLKCYVGIFSSSQPKYAIDVQVVQIVCHNNSSIC
jgi:hypothetical protein